jgi:hypothetical protein
MWYDLRGRLLTYRVMLCDDLRDARRGGSNRHSRQVVLLRCGGILAGNRNRATT